MIHWISHVIEWQHTHDVVTSLKEWHCMFQLDRTALQWAAANGHTEVMELLIEAGADIECQDKVWLNIISHIHLKSTLKLIKTTEFGSYYPCYFVDIILWTSYYPQNSAVLFWQKTFVINATHMYLANELPIHWLCKTCTEPVISSFIWRSVLFVWIILTSLFKVCRSYRDKQKPANGTQCPTLATDS